MLWWSVSKSFWFSCVTTFIPHFFPLSLLLTSSILPPQQIILELNTIHGGLSNNSRCLLPVCKCSGPSMWCYGFVFPLLLSGNKSAGTDYKYVPLRTVETTRSNLICDTFALCFPVPATPIACKHSYKTHIHSNNTCDCDFPQGHWGWSPSKVNSKRNTRPTAVSVRLGEKKKTTFFVLDEEDLASKGLQIADEALSVSV